MASRGTADSTCRPRLYVYDLPKTYRHKGSPTGRGFGPTLADNASAALKIHRAHTYGTGAAFYECAMTYACRTIDPSQADLFFIPAYTDRFITENYCAERPCRRSADALLLRLQRVVKPSGGTYLEARKGADADAPPCSHGGGQGEQRIRCNRHHMTRGTSWPMFRGEFRGEVN